MTNKCKGANCLSVDGRNHSPECIAKHDAAVHHGAGSRHPEARSRGYKKEPLDKNATADEQAAWGEGLRAREDT